jgi:hypothetical protein
MGVQTRDAAEIDHAADGDGGLAHAVSLSNICAFSPQMRSDARRAAWRGALGAWTSPPKTTSASMT